MNEERSERLRLLRRAETEAKRAKVALHERALMERREELSREADTRAARVQALRESEGRILSGGILADLHSGAAEMVRREVRAQRRTEVAERNLTQAQAEAVEAHREEERMRQLRDVERERRRREELRKSWTVADEQVLTRLAVRERAGPGDFGRSDGGGEGET